ncbi:hypothetical protein [Cytobacillus depressus]|nr:hypothetical protein [Cytobacillus depressus]
MRQRIRRRGMTIDDLKFGLTTIFLHISFYGLIVFILILFIELFS